MRAMKDSGIAWIGEIPEEWELVKTRRFFSNHKQVVGEEVDKYERLALTMNGVIKRSKDDSDGLQPEKFETYQILHKNELIFKLIDLENIKTSRVGLSPYTGLVSPAYIVLSSRFEDNRFFYYWFMFMYYNQVFNHLGGNGVRSALNAKDVLMLPVPNIQFPEQRRIADYLDRKCSQIDAIIARQQEVIEKLKAYKLSVITEAVTKGLNPHAPMKDSGVEWIGEIPEQWSVVPLTKQLKSIVDYRGKTPEKVDTGVFLVTAKNIKNGKIDYEISTEYVKVEDYEEIMHRGIPQIGDVLFTTEAPLGQVANVDRTDIALAQRIIKFSTNEHLDSYYLKYWIMSIGFQNFLMALSTGSTALGIKASKLFMLPITLPSIKEQQQIVTYLDNKCVSTEAAIMKKSSLIDSLIAYKRSLIYEIVTGKKEV